MERDGDFDSGAFLNLLGEVMSYHATGVVSVQIHIRDGMPWAVNVRFNIAAKTAA